MQSSNDIIINLTPTCYPYFQDKDAYKQFKKSVSEWTEYNIMYKQEDANAIYNSITKNIKNFPQEEVNKIIDYFSNKKFANLNFYIILLEIKNKQDISKNDIDDVLQKAAILARDGLLDSVSMIICKLNYRYQINLNSQQIKTMMDIVIKFVDEHKPISSSVINFLFSDIAKNCFVMPFFESLPLNEIDLEKIYDEYCGQKQNEWTELNDEAISSINQIKISVLQIEKIIQTNSTQDLTQLQDYYSELQLLLGKMLTDYLSWHKYTEKDVFENTYEFLATKLQSAIDYSHESLEEIEEGLQLISGDNTVDEVQSSATPLLSPSLPHIHYTWIGRPNPKVPGQDLCGPVAMANAMERLSSHMQNPIIFWCLDVFLDDYKEKLRTYNIKVCSIESAIEEALNNPDKRVKILGVKFNSMYQLILGNKDIQTVSTCDLVNLKNAFYYFHLAIRGGYTFDTNILPTKQESLHSYANFHLPCYTDLSIHPLKESADLEAWAFFAPEHSYNRLSEDLFNECYAIWYYALESYEYKVDEINERNTAEREEELESALKEYYRSPGNTAVLPLYHAYLNQAHFNTWVAQFTDDSHSMAGVESLGIQKTYSNTHKYVSRGVYDANVAQTSSADPVNLKEIFYFILYDNFNMLKTLLHMHALQLIHLNLNEQIPKTIRDEQGIYAYKGETLLHMAIRLKHKECVAVLMQRKDEMDLTLKAEYPNQPFFSLDRAIKNWSKGSIANDTKNYTEHAHSPTVFQSTPSSTITPPTSVSPQQTPKKKQ